MRNKAILAAVLGLAIGAAIPYGWRWRQNYLLNQALASLRDEVPEDEVGGVDLLDELDTLRVFEDIAKYTCMDDCCYTALSEDEVVDLGFPPDE